jgi:hypothetical protein
MIPDFQQYLIDNGFKRFKDVYDRGIKAVEDNENMNISTYGPTCYWFEKDGKNYLNWGLGIADKGVYYYRPLIEWEEFKVTTDFEETLNRLYEI